MARIAYKGTTLTVNTTQQIQKQQMLKAYKGTAQQIQKQQMLTFALGTEMRS